MNRIKYQVNGGKNLDVIHCQILWESNIHLGVLINNELEYKINKSKIVENVEIK